MHTLKKRNRTCHVSLLHASPRQGMTCLSGRGQCWCICLSQTWKTVKPSLWVWHLWLVCFWTRFSSRRNNASCLLPDEPVGKQIAVLTGTRKQWFPKNPSGVGARGRGSSQAGRKRFESAVCVDCRARRRRTPGAGMGGARCRGLLATGGARAPGAASFFSKLRGLAIACQATS